MKGLNDWINTNPKEDGRELRHLWDATASYKKRYGPNVNGAHEKFMKRIGGGIENDIAVVPMSNRFKVWRMAAMIAILIAAGVALKQLLVSDMEIEQIVTSPLEQKDFSLADGTVVNLNNNSQIDFPVEFGTEERKVNLSGEAFFHVARDESKPFIIATGKAEIKVLGTSFNVRSYSEESFIEVFVETGSVQVDIQEKENRHVLAQGEVLTYHYDNKSIEISKAIPENANAWKSGKLIFKNQPMGEIFEALERLHDISISAKNESLVACPFTISLNTKDLQSALNGLEVACDLKFTQKTSNEYNVHGSCCD